MKLENLNVVEILQIGVIGLGFLLALLAFWLLRKEQTKKQPHHSVLKQITIFMGFSITLCVLGLLGNLIPKPEAGESEKVTELKSAVGKLEEINRDAERMILKLEASSAFQLFSSVCKQPRYNCGHNTTADSEKHDWRGMSPVEQQVCRLVCDNL